MAYQIRIRYFFSTDPDPDPTCNNGFIKLFLSWTKYKSESTNSSIKWWVIISNFIPTYLKYKYIFFLHFDFRSYPESDPDPDFFFSWAGSGSGSVEKIPDPHPWLDRHKIWKYISKKIYMFVSTVRIQIWWKKYRIRIRQVKNYHWSDPDLTPVAETFKASTPS